MYVDQHTIEKMGTARLIKHYAPSYARYLESVFGRAFYLSEPVEIKGTTRLLARFVSDEAASGEDRSPCINLWVEFNAAMGLYTVWGEYWKNNEAQQPLYKSSPRTGLDGELLGDPARVFDWLDQVVSIGESSAKGSPMSKTTKTPVKSDKAVSDILRLSGADGQERYSLLRAVGASAAGEVTEKKSKPSAKAKMVGPFSTAMTPERAKLAKALSKNPDVKDAERLAFWIGLRAAGKKGGSAANESKENTMMNDIVSTLESIRIRLEGKAECEECGCEISTEEAVEGEDGEMLCEGCAEEMYESIEFVDDLDETTVLATVPSQSDPSKTYTIKMGKDGNVYCDCPAWKYQKASPKERTCKHIKSLYKAMDSQAKLKLPKATEGTAYDIGDGEFLVLEHDADLIIAALVEGAELAEQAEHGCQCEQHEDADDSDDDVLAEKASSKFKKLVGKLKKREDIRDPNALAAYIGAKKMGKGDVEKGRKILQKMAVKARKSMGKKKK